LRPPLLSVANIDDIVHGAARCIAHSHHGFTNEQGDLARSIARAVSSVLKHSPENTGLGTTSLRRVLPRCLIRGDDKDKGCQVALVAAGVECYIRDNKDDLDNKKEIWNCLIDIAGNTIGFAPVAGASGAVAGSFFKEWLRRKTERKKHAIARLLMQMKQDFEKIVFDPIQNTGKVTVLNEKGKAVTLTIDRTVFMAWRQRIQHYCDEDHIT
jgi:spore germination protein YaaH